MNLRNLPQYQSKDSTVNIDNFFKDNPELMKNTVTLSTFLNETEMDREAGCLVGEQEFIEEFAKENSISDYEMKNLLNGRTQYWRL